MKIPEAGPAGPTRQASPVIPVFPALPVLLKALTLLALLAGLALAGFPAALQAAEGRIDAYDPETGRLLFRGRVSSGTEGGLAFENTEYARPDGTVLQRIRLRYAPDSLQVAAYRLEDPRSGEMEALRGDARAVTLIYREKRGAREESATLPRSPAHTCTELLKARIRRNLPALLRGRTITMALLVPSRLDTVDFRATLEKRVKWEGLPALVVRAEPDFWLFRMMVAPLRFTFAADPPHRLLEYQGRSSVKTDKGNAITVRLVYR